MKMANRLKRNNFFFPLYDSRRDQLTMNYMQKRIKLMQKFELTEKEVAMQIADLMDKFGNLLYVEYALNMIAYANGWNVFELLSERVKSYLTFNEGKTLEQLQKRFPDLKPIHISKMNENVEIYNLEGKWYAHPMADWDYDERQQMGLIKEETTVAKKVKKSSKKKTKKSSTKKAKKTPQRNRKV